MLPPTLLQIRAAGLFITQDASLVHPLFRSHVIASDQLSYYDAFYTLLCLGTVYRHQFFKGLRFLYVVHKQLM
jgi:hypothetical protein